MSNKTADGHQHAVERFWHNYLSILEKHAIPQRSRKWYRRHVELYIAAHGGVRLAQHLPAHVDKYLTAKGRLSTLEEWRFRQIADALRLLFCELVCPAWAREYDWYRWRAFARELAPDHPTLMRDGNSTLVVAPSSNPLVRKFRRNYPSTHLAFVKTVRVRNMATRTESGYEQWICFFLAFLEWQDIDFDYQQITVRQGKGNKDRVVPLPEKLIPALQEHLSHTRSLHQDDLAAGHGEVLLPPALARKVDNPPRDYSTVTDFARFLGWSTSVPLATAT